MSGVAVHVRGLDHDYRTDEGVLRVVVGRDLDVEAGEFVALVGRSGAGKTTLLSLIGGLDRIQRGEVVVGDTALHRATPDELAAYRRDVVGFVFQDYGLLATLTALENVELAATFAGVSRAARRARALELLGAVELAERSGHRPSSLSGGESQRVAIARALVNQPALVLADEPTGNLDRQSASTVMDLLRRISDERRCTLIVVTHSATVAARADRVIELSAPAAVT